MVTSGSSEAEQEHVLVFAPCNGSSVYGGGIRLLHKRGPSVFKSNEKISEVAKQLAKTYEIGANLSIRSQEKRWKPSARVRDYGRGNYYIASSRLKECLLGGAGSQGTQHVPPAVLASLAQFKDPYKYEGCCICYDTDYWKRDYTRHGPNECCPDLTCC